MSQEMKKNIEEDENKFEIFGFKLPKKVSISCKKCAFKIYESYDKGDLITVAIMFIFSFVIVVVGIIIYMLKY
jgi:uncharacterized protein (DUF983 family)